jgi:hypothetical protein
MKVNNYSYLYTIIFSIVLIQIPANELPHKHYSLEPDLASGWVPKLKVIGPIPLNFDNNLTDRLVDTLLNERKTSFYSVVYLGTYYLEKHR